MTHALRAFDRYIRGSLQRRLLLAVVLVHSMLIALLIWQLALREGEHLANQRLDRVEGVAGILASSGAPWLLAEDLSALDELIKAASSMKALRYAMFVDREGRVLAHSDQARVGQYLNNARAKSLRPAAAGAKMVTRHNNSIDVAAPVFVDGRWIGWAWASVSLEDLVQSQRDLAVSAAWLGVVAVVLGFLIAFFTARSVTARLNDLAAVADRFRLGERTVRFIAKGSDEVATVGRGFNEMLDTLTASERSLKEVQKIAGLGTWCYHPSEPTLEWSEPVYELFGLDPQGPAPTFEQFRACLAPEHQQLVTDLVNRKHTRDKTSFSLTATRPDGTQRICWAEARSEICPETGEIILSGICQDITERETAAAQLRQAQKMEAVGQLTGGLAHDFNNLLAIVIGNLDLLAEQTEGQANAHECVEEALAAALRGSELTRQLLAFSRRQPLSPQVIDLNQLLERTSSLWRRTVGETIQVNVDLAADLWSTKADPAQVESAILNLVINARDAMKSGGVLSVQTKNVSQDEGDELNDVAAGDYCVISVADTGHGMPADVAARVFEPFFTTKEVGEGSGLGLSMVYGFAEQSGGHVRIYSEEGHGTVVRLYLPRAAADSDREPAALQSGELQRSAGEKVLLVEDNEGVRRIVARQLEELGYKVLPATNGPEALAVLDQEQAIDLLFTDVVMPGGMTGFELGDLAKGKRPHLKVLYTSGFTHWGSGGSSEVAKDTALLSKPYRKADLAAKLREVLDDIDPEKRTAA